MRTPLSILVASIIFITSCNSGTNQEESKNPSEPSNESTSILEKVDLENESIQSGISAYDWHLSLDHHRMAQETGTYTPPAIATLFSNPAINTSILNQSRALVGLDLPFKVLTYSEKDTAHVSIAYTRSDFIAKRHGLTSELLDEYRIELGKVLERIDPHLISPTSLDSVVLNYGIVQLKSDFDFDETIQRLTKIVMAQSDTRWFGEIDFQKDAAEFGVQLKPNKLLLFGGPAPGAKAMMTTPKIGLDAFCQKLLVFENDEGEVVVAYNDIVAFSSLYYGYSTKPQQLINKRLKATFLKAISTSNP